MKKLIVSLVLFIALTTLKAQPQFFTYQTLVRGSDGSALTDQLVSFQIGILQDSVNGIAVYREGHLVTTNDFGLVILEIGKGNPVSGSFQEINWAEADHFLEVGLDISGGNMFTIMGVTQLMSVPYALHAQSVESISGNLLPPSVSDLEASMINQEGATLNGFINPMGFSTSAVFEYGLTTGYGQTAEVVQNPVTGSSDVAVHSVLSGLQAGTLYHFRLKATNAVDVSWSEDASFVTEISAPLVTTLPATDISTTSATLVGNVVNDGGAAVSVRGFFWGPFPDPQTTGVQITAGSGIGEFTAGLTGLMENTGYYFVAFATNSEGTSYGNVAEFTTDPLMEVTYRVDLTEAVAYGSLTGFDTAVHKIYITGNMMNWAEPGSVPEQQQLTRISDSPLIYSKTMQLDAGTYQYKYFSDAIGSGWSGGEWGGDPNRMLLLETDMTVEDVWAIYCTMPVQPVAGNNGPSFCEGADILLYVNTGNSWHWRGPLGFTSYQQNPVIPSSTYNMGGLYSVFVTDENGCSAYATTSLGVTACLSLPNMMSTCAAGNCEYTCFDSYYDCDGNLMNGCESYLPYDLEATSNSPVTVGNDIYLGVNGGTSWFWTGPDGFTSTEQYPVIYSSTLQNSGIYTVILNDGCFYPLGELSVNVIVTE